MTPARIPIEPATAPTRARNSKTAASAPCNQIPMEIAWPRRARTRPRWRPTSAASSTRPQPPERFPVRFYLVAMIFIVFDIEIIFLYPFTMVFRELGGFGLAVIGIFSVAVFESFVYLIANGALDWGPIKRLRHGAMVDHDPHARHDRAPSRARGPRPAVDHLDADRGRARRTGGRLTGHGRRRRARTASPVSSTTS